MRKTLICMAAVATLAAMALAEQPVDVTRPVDPDATISIENLAGSLTVVGTDAAEVVITGTMGDDVEELEISGDAEELKIEVVIPDDDDWKGKGKLEADLEVRVPRGASLEIETVSAAIEISGVRGEIEAESVSGAVTVAGGANEVEAVSVSGAVTVTGGAGMVVAESVSGNVMLAGVSGDIEATTVSGKVRVEAGMVDDVELESVAGNVYFKGQLTDGDLEIESHSGNVEAHLPAGLVADFSLESFSGSIDNGFGPPARRADRWGPGVSVEFSTGSDGADVVIETFSGNIVLKSF